MFRGNIQGRRVGQARNQREAGSKRFMLHRHAFVYLPFFYLGCRLLNIFDGKNLKGSPDFLRNHPCGDLPIRRIQPRRFGNGKFLLSRAEVVICYWPSPALWPLSSNLTENTDCDCGCHSQYSKHQATDSHCLLVIKQ
jgi:hypothetical protein